ncbi:MAG: EamA family transporter [Cyanobacteria bacterium P01_F01_bin.150]
MSWTSFLLLLGSVLTNVIGQFFLKTGALKLAQVNSRELLHRLLDSILIPELWIGLSFYGVGAIAYILLLSKVPLSIAGPSISLSYVCSVMMGAIFFNESIPISRLVGLGMIICGVILLMVKE